MALMALDKGEHLFYFHGMRRCPTCQTPRGKTTGFNRRRVAALLALVVVGPLWGFTLGRSLLKKQVDEP